MPTQGQLFRQAIAAEKPLQIVGTINAYTARMAQEIGYQAIYLSGAGVANAKFALPDLAMTSLDNVLNEVTPITQSCPLPLLVDADTGWGSPLNVARTFKLLAKAGAAGAHIEDQTESKRCGHRGGKRIVSTNQMTNRIKAAVDGRDDPTFFVMARTDAIAVEELDAAIERALAYQEAGADGIFVEAATTLDQYRAFAQQLSVPILANMTEFGQTPLFTTQELASAQVAMALYPLSAFRAMNQAALNVYSTLRSQGTQKSLLSQMQTRDELYHYLKYHQFERTVDAYLEEKE